MKNELIPLTLQAKLREAQPTVTVPSYETARQVLKAMNMYSAGNQAAKDENGKTYWYASIKDLLALVDSQVINNKSIGLACNAFQLARKRENNGWHVAWSQSQLDILNETIK